MKAIKRYESLIIEILTSFEVISTSSDVTTGGIIVPWQKSADYSSFELGDDTKATTFDYNSFFNSDI